MPTAPKRKRTKKSILITMPDQLLSRLDAEVRRRQQEGDMVTRSSLIRDAILGSLTDSKKA